MRAGMSSMRSGNGPAFCVSSGATHPGASQALLRARNIGDFTRWKDRGAYKQSFDRVSLLKARLPDRALTF